MKVEIKIYKTFDPDLYALSAYGIRLTSLIKTALKYYVRGEYVHFHIPKSLTYDFSMKRKSIHLAMDITDPESVKFLKENVKPRLRTAFLKALIRGSFTTPQLGVFFRNEALNKTDTRMIKLADVEDLVNLEVLTVSQKPRKEYELIPKENKKAHGNKNPGDQEKQEKTEFTQKEEYPSTAAKKQKNKKKRKKDRQNRDNDREYIADVNNHQKVETNYSKDEKHQEDYKPIEKERTSTTSLDSEEKAKATPTPQLEDKFGLTVKPEKDTTPKTEEEEGYIANAPILVPEDEDEDENLFDAFNNLMQ